MVAICKNYLNIQKNRGFEAMDVFENTSFEIFSVGGTIKHPNNSTISKKFGKIPKKSAFSECME